MKEKTIAVEKDNKLKKLVKNFGLPRLIITGFLLLLFILAPIVGADFFAQLTLHVLGGLPDGPVQLREDPAVGDLELIPGGQLVLLFREVHHHVAAGVPELVGEIAHGLAALHVEAHIVAGAVAGDHVHAQGVGTIAVDHFQRINAVAQRLGHLAALVVAHQTVDQDRMEGRLSGVLVGGENHPGNPERNNVVAGDQHVSGIEVIQVRGLIGPAQNLKGPER